ncbi:MAG TPA: YbhB/YbcL family Raf kinase inhibitor-like protein [Gemmatimonadaceae bacterium]|nr:YbhB/YbcL family Raf kinase inhibitor-like protein [Gemmatimonadaceae bacterium]
MRTLLVLAACGIAALVPRANAQQTAKGTTAAPRFTLTSPDLTPNGRIAEAHVFNGMGCSGRNVSPALVWKNAPTGTKSFAVTVYDPDAPTGSGWWHWVIYNIPASVTSLSSGAGDATGTAAPRGSVQGNTDFGTPGYGGPCPPAGDKPHHYVFTVYALKVDKLDLPAGATAAYVGFNLHANAIGNATLTALYGR